MLQELLHRSSHDFCKDTELFKNSGIYGSFHNIVVVKLKGGKASNRNIPLILQRNLNT